MVAILTYLTHPDGGPAGAPPRVGDRVHLRRASGGADTEAWSDSGQRLGRLPPAERTMLDSLGLDHSLTAHVAAVLPSLGALRAERVLLQVDMT